MDGGTENLAAALRQHKSVVAVGWSTSLPGLVEAAFNHVSSMVVEAAGKDLFPLIFALRQWGERHAFAAGEDHSVLVYDNWPSRAELIPIAADGTKLTSENARVTVPVDWRDARARALVVAVSAKGMLGLSGAGSLFASWSE